MHLVPTCFIFFSSFFALRPESFCSIWFKYILASKSRPRGHSGAKTSTFDFEQQSHQKFQFFLMKVPGEDQNRARNRLQKCVSANLKPIRDPTSTQKFIILRRKIKWRRRQQRQQRQRQKPKHLQRQQQRRQQRRA